MIPVNKPFLPPLDEYQQMLTAIWEKNILTNNGPNVKSLEASLADYFDLRRVHLVSSGTMAIQIALKALQVRGEVLTTPFSYVATTSSIVWENCVPKFVDIEPLTLNIDPSKIEEAITEDTSAILATHCFGNSCDIYSINAIAKRNNLKVIYDAAHSFGSHYDGSSVFKFGDVSITSFHSTKLFHTVEGGALFTSDPKVGERIDFLRNFGHDGPECFDGVGINGKMSEIHAAMGLVNLRYVNDILQSRREQFDFYKELLSSLEISLVESSEISIGNHSYFPILFKSEDELLKALKFLANNGISTRRYFYPPLNHLNYVKSTSLPVVEDISRRILCLPMYFQLTREEQKRVVIALEEALK
ncbi:DegT/DnrJ/EryC1/StrS family aminotransferase [Marinoscillum pacificum]|uniref:DegT/DnrJ/EryC1/StrS family aminotransferase n=1 Tax=Marinoscillum pacificum TaxID=392723 RepID=UPI002157B9F1|nr:DegT/DnrJ/EryC1/StrS family aminotransferase [Marinoscillum pacificum]